jgi:hypothetical protein
VRGLNAMQSIKRWLRSMRVCLAMLWCCSLGGRPSGIALALANSARRRRACMAAWVPERECMDKIKSVFEVAAARSEGLCEM